MDLDLFDDLPGRSSGKNVRPGGKFQPKVKPRPLKKNAGETSAINSRPPLTIDPPEKNSGVTLITNPQPVSTSDVSEKNSGVTSIANSQPALTSEVPEKNSIINSQPISSTNVLSEKNSGVTSVTNSQPVPISGVSERVYNELSGAEKPTSSALDSVADIFMPESNDDWHSCFENPMRESADIFIGLESLEFLPDSATVLDKSVPFSEAPNVHACGSRDAEDGVSIPAVDDSVCISSIPNISSETEISASQDPLTSADHTVATNGHLADNRNLGMEELETCLCLKSLDTSLSASSFDKCTGKFKPKPKMQAYRQRNDIDDHIPNLVKPVPYQQDSQSVPPTSDVVEKGLGPDDVRDFSSIEQSHVAPSQSMSEGLADEEAMDVTEASCGEANIPGENLEAVPGKPGKLVSHRAKPGKSKTHAVSDHSPKEQRASTSSETIVAGISLRQRRKPINACRLVDESEDEGLEDGNIPAESLSDSVENEDNISNSEVQLDNEPQKKNARSKSKKPGGEKPVRKRKKDTEASEPAAGAAPKKFSHTTRRSRADKALLETPEDEIDFRKVPLRDLILLAEHKERTQKKQAKASQAPLPNPSNGTHNVDSIEDEAANAFEHYGENETFALAQGGEANEEQEPHSDEEGPSYFNYHTYMNKTPRSRWTKQDTELFYEALRQFGTDLSMIQQLFPGRTRRQVKLKYKKEERQHPLRLREALSNASKDHFHFERVIERLNQIAAEEKQNSRAESISLTGEEEMEEETFENNDVEAKSDEAAKTEQMDGGVVDNKAEPDFPEAQSPVVEESRDGEDDDDGGCFWGEYKSEV